MPPHASPAPNTAHRAQPPFVRIRTASPGFRRRRYPTRLRIGAGGPGRHNGAPHSRFPHMPSPIALPGLAIIGGGPAGLMAAEVARAAGAEVDLFEAKGSVGRKFLIAGKGGLNLTHGEPRPGFDQRYGSRSAEIG